MLLAGVIYGCDYLCLGHNLFVNKLILADLTFHTPTDHYQAFFETTNSTIAHCNTASPFVACV